MSTHLEINAMPTSFQPLDGSLGYGILLVLLASASLVYSQGTFQKLILDAGLLNHHDVRLNAVGGVTFTCWIENRFGASGKDIMLVSLDDHGDTLWTKVFGREFDDLSFSLLSTADGGYLIAGTSRSGISSLDPLRTLLIKTNASGDTLWTRAYLALYEGFSTIECQDGGFFMVGNPIAGFYMVRVNAKGELVWTSGFDRFEPPDYDHQFSAYSAVECADGGFLVVGRRDGGSGFLSKVNLNGVLEWTKLAVTSNGLMFRRIIRTADGRFIILGGTNGYNVLLKTDSLGNPIWTMGYAAPANGAVLQLTTTSDGGFALIGDTGPSDDVYFLKTDSVGDVLHSGSFGDVGWDVGRSIVEALDGGYFLGAWSGSFGSNSSVFMIKTDSAGRGGCYYQDVETTVSTVEITWSDFELDTLNTTVVEVNAGCMMGAGVSPVPICPVGVSSPDGQNNSIQLYPNPATDRILVAIPKDHSQTVIEVFNAIGERVLTQKSNSSQTTFDCSSFARGIYLVKITTATKTLTQRVVLE